MESKDLILDSDSFTKYCRLVKKYINLRKVLFHVDKKIAEDFFNKQIAFYEKKFGDKSINKSCCEESILNQESKLQIINMHL